MKKTIYAAFVFAALGLTACNSGEETKEENTENAENKEEKVEAVKYNLVASESEVNWVGTYLKPDEEGNMVGSKSHNGYVKFSEGSAVVKGDDISGNFVVDMTSITNEDLSEEDGKNSLENHLRGTTEKEDKNKHFFNTGKYATADVQLKSIENGEANIVLTVLGVDMEETVPVMTKIKGDKMMIKGDFTIDFSALEMPGTQANPEKPEDGQVSPKVDFSLNIVMKK